MRLDCPGKAKRLGPLGGRGAGVLSQASTEASLRKQLGGGVVRCALGMVEVSRQEKASLAHLCG